MSEENGVWLQTNKDSLVLSVNFPSPSVHDSVGKVLLSSSVEHAINVTLDVLKHVAH